jgi:hypothetical protein
MARGASAPPEPPRLLQRLYGAANVLPLGDLVLQLARSSREAAALPDTLVQPFDHSDYADALLARTFCIVRPGAPPLSDGFSLRRASTQVEVRHPFKPPLSIPLLTPSPPSHTAPQPRNRSPAAGPSGQKQRPVLWLSKGEFLTLLSGCFSRFKCF